MDRLERQKKAFIAEFGLDDADEEEEENDGEPKEQNKLVIKLPDWLKARLDPFIVQVLALVDFCPATIALPYLSSHTFVLFI